MQRPELRNPFTNGRLVALGANPDKYHQQDARRGTKHFAMSRSELCEFNHCPRRWMAGYRSDGSTSTEWGGLIDCLLLEPEQFNNRYAVAPETYPAPKHHAKVKKGEIAEGDPLPWNSNATECDQWESKQAGKIIIKAKEKAFAAMAVDRLYADEEISFILKSSNKQVWVEADYKDSATGITIRVKALVDIAPTSGQYSESLIDFKTARDAHPSKWPKVIHESDYHIQGALHLDVFNTASNEERIEFRHIIQENFAPWEPALSLMSMEFLEEGRARYISMLRRYCQCLSENRWPGYEESTRYKLKGWPVAEIKPHMLEA